MPNQLLEHANTASQDFTSFRIYIHRTDMFSDTLFSTPKHRVVNLTHVDEGNWILIGLPFLTCIVNFARCHCAGTDMNKLQDKAYMLYLAIIHICLRVMIYLCFAGERLMSEQRMQPVHNILFAFYTYMVCDLLWFLHTWYTCTTKKEKEASTEWGAWRQYVTVGNDGQTCSMDSSMSLNYTVPAESA